MNAMEGCIGPLTPVEVDGLIDDMRTWLKGRIDDAGAEDLIQEVFKELLEDGKRKPPPATLKEFAHGAFVRLYSRLFDYWRMERRESERLGYPKVTAISPQDGPSRIAELREARRTAAVVCAALSEEHRRLMEVWMDGRKVEDHLEELGLTLAQFRAAKARLIRAIKKACNALRIDPEALAESLGG